MSTTEGQHTPGPWTWERDDSGWADVLVGAGGAVVIDADDTVSPVLEDDARLIAAAPDLLAALEEFVGVERDRTDGFSKVSALRIVACYDMARGVTP
jgi:hypothetical protein